MLRGGRITNVCKRFTQYQTYAHLLSSLKSHFDDFVVDKRELRRRRTTVSVHTQFSFDGEFSIVVDPSKDAEDTRKRMRGILTDMEDFVGLMFRYV
jgi:hypothetical protein